MTSTETWTNSARPTSRSIPWMRVISPPGTFAHTPVTSRCGVCPLKSWKWWNLARAISYGRRRACQLACSSTCARYAALNDLTPDPHDFVFGDAFDWLRRLARRNERFDLVIVDPPSFSSTPFSVVRDYPRLIEAAVGALAPGGILLAATNHSSTSDQRFDAWLDNGLARARRHGQLLQQWQEPAADFPVPPGRGPYLKVRALVLD